MSLKSLTKKIFLFIFIAIIVILLINFGLSIFLTNKIKDLNGEYTISVKEAKVNIITQSITVNNLIINSRKKGKDSLHFDTTELYIKGVSLSDIRNPQTINLSSIKISSPHIKIYQGDTTSGKNNKAMEDLKSFKVKDLKINNGKMTLFNADSDTTWHIKKINLAYKEFKTDSSLVTNRMPYTYNEQLIEVENMMFKMNEYQNIVLENLSLDNAKATIHNLQIVPQYNKHEFQGKITEEKDWIELDVKSLIVNKINLNNKEIVFDSEKIEIDSASLYVYRNKLMPDQTKYKPLYSKMLRELPFKLNVDSVNIKNSSIVYEERINADGKPGRLEFTKFNSLIKNINNNKNSGITDLNIKTRFMDNADFNVHWSFEVANTADYFNIRGRLLAFDASFADKFITPNFNSKAKGVINLLDFNIRGNDVKANGNIEMKYEGLKFEIINKDKTKVNKFLSSVANLFVKKNEKIPESKEIEVERDQQKSFFNYFWLCIEDGLMATIL